MKIFLDSACVEAISYARETGFLQGVTTNPTLIAKEAGAHCATFQAWCVQLLALHAGWTSIEVTYNDCENMVLQAQQFAQWASQARAQCSGDIGELVIKVPLSWQGLKACRLLTNQGFRVNVTLCFSVVQALMAAHAGAFFVSPFMGRLEDNGGDGYALLSDIRQTYDAYGLRTQILAASVRHLGHVRQALSAHVDAVTVAPSLFNDLVAHPLTMAGMQRFDEDWARFDRNKLQESLPREKRFS